MVSIVLLDGEQPAIEVLEDNDAVQISSYIANAIGWQRVLPQVAPSGKPYDKLGKCEDAQIPAKPMSRVNISSTKIFCGCVITSRDSFSGGDSTLFHERLASDVQCVYRLEQPLQGKKKSGAVVI